MAKGVKHYKKDGTMFTGATHKMPNGRKRGNMAGLYDNIHNKRRRIASGSGEKMRKPGTKGAPTKKAFEQSKKTVRKRRMA